MYNLVPHHKMMLNFLNKSLQVISTVTLQPMKQFCQAVRKIINLLYFLGFALYWSMFTVKKATDKEWS